MIKALTAGDPTKFILRVLFRLDVTTAPWLRPPFGVSALVVAM